ncbi:MAG: apolipoprotein N-acyltransferase [Candidatus Portnoybacteria bacterium]|nr:apolipoprotein N-acyltransferase [Candidatus Portnoybacteria bacterium]
MKFLKLSLKNNLIFVLPILSGILLILAYPPYDLEFLIWIALIPLLYFLSLKIVSIKKAFIGGAITGVLFFGKLFTWLFATAPFEWLGVSSGKNVIFVFVLVILLWLVQTLFFGLFFGVFSWAVKKSKVFNLSLLSYIILFPCLWIILEYLRAWSFGILWIGKETLFGPHWTFGNLAYSLHDIPILIQIADIVGIYGTSFLIVFINTALFFAFLKIKKRKIILSIFIILVLVVSAWAIYGIYKLKIEEKGEERKIALIQTNFTAGVEFNSYQRKEVFETLLNLFQSEEALQKKADFVITPEGFGIISLVKDTKIANYLVRNFWQPGQIFLESQKIIDENQRPKSRLFYYDLEKTNPVAFHDKMLLVPNGEFLPYLTKGLLSIYSFNIKYEQRLSQPGEKINPAQTEKGTIGGTICSSILSPNLNRQMTKNGAQFLVVVSSDAPFHGAETLLAQNLAMSKLRAIENRRYFAQSTNMGYSFLINPKGKVVTKNPELGNKILFSDIQLINKKTIYTRFNDWIIVLAILVLFFLTFKKWYNKQYLKHEKIFNEKSAF